MGDSHRITSGQDWEQEISLQLTLIGDLEYGHQTAVSVVSKKAEIEKEEEVLVDAIGNPRTRTIVRQPTGWINPVSNVGISTTGNQSWGQGQDFGERVLKGKNDFHNGVDIVPGVNKNGVKDLGIYMVKKAKVIAVVNQGNSGCGKGLKFQFTDVGANEPEYGMYCHLDSYNTHKNGDPIEVGNIINQGERIGTMGTSGGVAIHLHYGLNLGNKSFSSDEENTGVDPAYFLSGEDNVTDLREGLTYNHYDINGLIRDIKDYVEYSQGASPDADVQAAKVSFIRDNYNFPSNTHVSNPISEYMTTGTLKAENYPNLPSAPSIGTLKL
jgi:murein DD-endopeptidase MepM/ murein hydrolase activator NlpD